MYKALWVSSRAQQGRQGSLRPVFPLKPPSAPGGSQALLDPLLRPHLSNPQALQLLLAGLMRSILNLSTSATVAGQPILLCKTLPNTFCLSSSRPAPHPLTLPGSSGPQQLSRNMSLPWDSVTYDSASGPGTTQGFFPLSLCSNTFPHQASSSFFP